MSSAFIFTASVPPCHLELMPGYRLSVHAWQRMCARGHSPDAVRAALEHGRIAHVREADFYIIGRAEIAAAARTGFDLRRLDGLHVVVADDGTIKTVFRNRELSEVQTDWKGKPRRRATCGRRAA